MVKVIIRFDAKGHEILLRFSPEPIKEHQHCECIASCVSAGRRMGEWKRHMNSERVSSLLTEETTTTTTTTDDDYGTVRL